MALPSQLPHSFSIDQFSTFNGKCHYAPIPIHILHYSTVRYGMP